MSWKIFLSMCLVLTSLVVMEKALLAQTSSEEESVKKDLIALVYKEWEGTMKKDMDQEFANHAEDVMGFAQASPYLDEGLKLLKARRKPLVESQETYLVMEMANPRIRLFGNVAVLAYNFLGVLRGRDNNIVPLNAKSTRVYVREGRRWKLAHYHFTDATPTRIH